MTVTAMPPSSRVAAAVRVSARASPPRFPTFLKICSAWPDSAAAAAAASAAPTCDLYIFLSLAQHQLFQRDGADLHCRVPISMVTAALGGEFEVPTIDSGKTKAKVPAGTQSGRRFRIASKGMPVLRSRQMGDMYVQVMVETPQNLTKKQQELLSEFEKLSSGATQPEAAGFFTKVKDFFGNRAGS